MILPLVILQRLDSQWTRAKGFDTFAPIGPFIETELDPDNADIRLRLNGKVMQESNTSNFIFKTDYLVSAISQIMTLYPETSLQRVLPPVLVL